MATNCMRKLFNKGEYVFRQGDVPNQLCVILDGKIEIIREIVYSRCNRWPVGKLHM
jgi:CRP-like cAMP-binding protein